MRLRSRKAHISVGSDFELSVFTPPQPPLPPPPSSFVLEMKEGKLPTSTVVRYKCI